MSDQGGASEAGWQPDPHGRHEYRYWDGNGWTDQVSNGGVVSTDPPGDASPADAPTEVSSTDTVATPIPAGQPAGPPTGGPPTGPPTAGVPAYVPPGDRDGDKPKRKVPVGILALIGLAVAGIVAALVIFLGGGDDDGGGTGDFAGTISDDEPFAVRTFDMDAGEALRVIVKPDGDLNPALTLGIDTDLAQTELFGATGDNLDDLLSDYSFNYEELFSEAFDGDVSSDLSSALSDDFTDFRDTLVDRVPSLEDAGVPLVTTNNNEDGDDEGFMFLAPLSGTYSVIVSGLGTEGDFDATIETAGPDEDFDEFSADDDLDIQKYYEAIEPHRDFLCDEDFWGGPPEDVTSDAEQICDDDAFSDLLSGDFSSDFSDDASDDLTSDFSDDFSDDFSSDFSSDFSDLFTDDFSDDFSDDFTDEDQGSISVGDSANGSIDVGTRDTYTIEGTGSQVTIEIIGSNDTGGLDPTVTVLDSSGNEVGFNDDGDPSDIGDSLLEVRLERGETYTIAVAGFGSTSGDYTINVS